MSVDPRVVELCKKHGCTFYPNSIIEYQIKMRHDRKYPKSYIVFHEIIFHTLYRNLEKGRINFNLLKTFMLPKTFLRYIEHFQSEGLILVEDVPGEKFVKIIGLNPFKFGKLFPSYEDALKSIEGL
jgi:hypothetical protein